MTTSGSAEPIYRENDFYVPYFKVLIGSRELEITYRDAKLEAELDRRAAEERRRRMNREGKNDSVDVDGNL